MKLLTEFYSINSLSPGLTPPPKFAIKVISGELYEARKSAKITIEPFRKTFIVHEVIDSMEGDYIRRKIYLK